MRSKIACLVGFAVFIPAAFAGAQSTSIDPARAVPPFVRFSGTIDGAQGPTTLTFAFYAEQTGGTPLWSETQDVVCDANGRYTVALGAASTGGIPPELFASGEASWVGVRPAGGAERPRVAVLTVPYAARAATADTIAGKPATAFLQVGERTGVGADGVAYLDLATLSKALNGSFGQGANEGTANYLGMFTNTTDLGNSVVYQAGSRIGVNTLAPGATFHVMSPETPAAYFDVFSDALGALPVVYRAARGTPAAPSAVQTDDILGGLAVRGFGATSFSAGRGQVMFRAAENWTDSAHGTYLEMTTTPVGSTTWEERLRIDPSGKVGIGHVPDASSARLTVSGTIRSTTGGFVFPDGTTMTGLASNPGFGRGLVVDSWNQNSGTVYSGAIRFGGGNTGEAIASPRQAGTNQYGLDFYSNFTPRMSITVDGYVGIGTRSPAFPLHITGTTRIEGMVRLGTETGTAELPEVAEGYTGLVVRRVTSINADQGVLVATVGPAMMQLERNGTAGGFQVNVGGVIPDVEIACMGVNSAGAAVNKVLYPILGVTTLYTDTDDVVYIHCSFGATTMYGHATEVTLFRRVGSGRWVGTLTSTYNQ